MEYSDSESEGVDAEVRSVIIETVLPSVDVYKRTGTLGENLLWFDEKTKGILGMV